MLRLEDRQAPPQEAILATGRKLAVIMHAIWRDGAVHADRPHADDRSDAAPSAKERKLLGVRA